MENSTAAKCWFRDDALAKAFTSLHSAQVANTSTACIIRQILGEMLAGVSTDSGSTGYKNPISLSGKRSLGELFQGFGLPVSLIGKIAIKRGGKFSDVRLWTRAYNGESPISGTFFTKELLENWANKAHYDENGDAHKLGIFNDEGRVISYDGDKVTRVGKAYFIHNDGYWSYGHTRVIWVRN
jgi:hypothetical protein